MIESDTMSTATTSGACGPSLVIGGCGFIGFHIVEALLEEPAWGPVLVISRNPNPNRCEGASYHKGDICNPDEIQQLLADLKPRIIFYTAAPRAADPAIVPGDHLRTSVEGTKTVLSAATKDSSTVRALVYTSSVSVSKGVQHFNDNETMPLCDHDSNTIPYYKSKAVADTIVREANCPIDLQGGKGLLTATLRISVVYGERDNQFIPGMLKTASDGQAKIQLGNNQNMMDPTYIGNAVKAHLLAGQKLLDSASRAGSSSLKPSAKVDGEAFFITDGSSLPFWTFARMIWRTAGDETTEDQVTVVPAWLALGLANGIDWAFYLCTFGRVRPPLKLSPLYIGYTTLNHTYDISKARERLGYNPVVEDREAQIRKAVEWELGRWPERYGRLVKGKAEGDFKSASDSQKTEY